MHMSEEITPREARDLSGYSLDHIWWLCRTGRIKARDISGRYLIDKEDFLAYCERMKQDPRGGPRRKE
jgi:hypothetical protein